MSDITVNDIHAWIEQLKGDSLNGDEGISFGESNRAIAGVTVCWMPSAENIQAAAKEEHQLLIHHEALMYPYPFENKWPRDVLSWPANVQRVKALSYCDLTATRLHGSIDRLWIFQATAEQLGLKKVHAAGANYLDRVFEIEPTPYGKLIERVKQVMEMSGVRATNVNPDRTVRYVGMPWGGMGLFVNSAYVQSLINLCPQVDVMIAGETDNYGFRLCTEQGIDVIETSHELSEHRGLAVFAKALEAQFPSLQVRHIADPCVWQMR